MAKATKKHPAYAGCFGNVWSNEMKCALGDFDSSASFFQSFFSSFSFFFADFLFDSAWSVVNETFSFTKAKTGKVFNSLNNSNFLSTSVLKGNGELSFFVGGSSATFGRSSSNSYSRCSGANAPVFF